MNDKRLNLPLRHTAFRRPAGGQLYNRVATWTYDGKGRLIQASTGDGTAMEPVFFAYGAPAAPGDLLEALAACGFDASADGEGIAVEAPAADVRLGLLLLAHGWAAAEPGSADTRTRVAPLS